MQAELISVGTEILLGDILNTNAQYLSTELATMGIDVFYQSTVGDNADRLKETLAMALSRSNIIILTGGLGPTQDDITVETVADLVGLPLEEDRDAYAIMKKHFKAQGKKMAKSNEKQAYVPQGATVFYNNHGTAPGCAIAQGDQVIIMLPGVPFEMTAMFEEQVKDYLGQYSKACIKSKFVNIFGIGESTLCEEIDDILENENPTVAPYAKEGRVDLRVSAKAKTESEAEIMCDSTIAEIKERLGSFVYSSDNESLQEVVCKLLKKQGKTLATAESCTAGLISKMITDVSGASNVFSLGVATYQNSQKTEILGVDEKVIIEKGAVSLEVAAAMAQGVLYKSNAECTLSITGLAGPEGDGSDTQVGTAFIGLADKNTTYVVKIACSSRMGREYVRNCFALAALNLLRLYLEGYDLTEVEYLQEVVSMPTPEKPEEKVAEPEVRVETEVVEKVVEKIVYVDKEPEVVEKIVYVDKEPEVVEKIVYVDKEPEIVEKIVYVDKEPEIVEKIVEKIVYVEKEPERPALNKTTNKKIQEPKINKKEEVEILEDIGDLIPNDISVKLPEVDKENIAQSLDSLF